MSRIVFNTLGQIADADKHLAAGYYLYDNADDSGIPGGCGGLRPGFIELGNGTRLPTCAGNLITEYLPDMVLVDDWFKPFVNPLLIVAILACLPLAFTKT
jgi:hypothetical protein